MTTYTFRKGAVQNFKKVEKLEDIETPDETKKFNLRISNGDLDFIKFLATKEGISRNKLIDDLVESIIQDFLESLKTEEYIMLIKLADRLNHVNTWRNMEKSWISNLYPSRAPYELIDNDLNNQAPINDLSERSERYKRMFTTLVNSKLVKEFNDQLKGNEANETEE